MYRVIGLLCLPLIWGVYQRLQLGLTYGATQPVTPKNLIKTLGEFLGLGQWPHRPVFGILLGSIAVLLILRAILKRSGFGWRPALDDPSVWILGTWIGGPFVVIYMYSLVMPPATFHRYFIASAVGIYALFGIGLDKFTNRRVASAVAIIILVGFATTSAVSLVAITQPDWQSGVAYIDVHAESGDLVISGNPQSPDEFTYYSNRSDLKRGQIGYSPTPEAVAEVTDDANRVWLVGFSGRIDTVKRILSEECEIAREKSYHRLDVYLFTNEN